MENRHIFSLQLFFLCFYLILGQASLPQTAISGTIGFNISFKLKKNTATVASGPDFKPRNLKPARKDASGLGNFAA
jgi:hypothetical protein